MPIAVTHRFICDHCGHQAQPDFSLQASGHPSVCWPQPAFNGLTIGWRIFCRICTRDIAQALTESGLPTVVAP
jgi:hypothetical protein